MTPNQCVECEGQHRCSFVETQWKPANVMCIGLSVKPQMVDLDPASKSGRLIAQIETKFGGDPWHKSNLVKHPPLMPSGHLRYPSRLEMRRCLELLRREVSAVSPSVILCLGVLTSEFLLQEMGGQKFQGFGSRNKYSIYRFGSHTIIPVHHPAYIVKYKQSNKREYISGVCKAVNSAIYR